ncbi:hypothetical protein JCM33374_g5921 [Metschnikowia sp. JCM 33374]|nr:hypothetical protein JCM33374_g5921 [Metschnikowia sp. JCM 33374]
MSGYLIDAFKTLNLSTAQDSSDHEAVFDISYQYLSMVKNFNDINSFHNCIVSLINYDKYYRALQLLDQVPEEVHSEFPVEKAYVYYKTGHFDRLKALYETTTSASNIEISNISRRALKHVMAQSFYQNGHITEALSLYRELISTNSVDNELDVACNERAILSQLASKGSATEKPVSSVSDAEKTYDIVFNEALTELAKGNTSASLTLLNTASSMCLDQNMDLDPADLALEIAPIKLTVAYIHQINGNTRQALGVLEDTDLVGVTDLMTRLTFRNNYLSLCDTPENVNFLSRELSYKDNLHRLRHKLTKPQFQVLVRNNLLLAYQTGTLPKTSSYFRSKFYNQYAEDFVGDITPILFKVLLKLEVSLRDLQSPHETRSINRKLYKFCLQRLELNSHDDETVAAALLLVHMNSKAAKYEQAILVLEKLVAVELNAEPEKLHASIFGALISIYETQSGTKKPQALYKSLIDKFGTLSPETLAQNQTLYGFVRAFAFKLLAANTSQDTASLLKLLNEANPKDGLVSSVLTGDHSGLVPAEELASSEEVEDLLAVNIEELIPRQSTANLPSSARESAGPYKVTKKSHKPKFSKNKAIKPTSEFNAEKDLDKERWLPLKLRSYYKPSKKDLKKKVGGHQGAVEAAPAPVPAATQTTTSSGSSKSKNKNKKKKKGKK